MTIFEVMKARALAEFDRMVEQREVSFREELTRQGRSAAEIDEAISACRPDIQAQRATVGSIVTVALLKNGLPVNRGANDNVGA